MQDGMQVFIRAFIFHSAQRLDCEANGVGNDLFFYCFGKLQALIFWLIPDKMCHL
jgi:hypothetical protein